VPSEAVSVVDIVHAARCLFSDRLSSRFASVGYSQEEQQAKQHLNFRQEMASLPDDVLAEHWLVDG
jgi:hypothetical protein